MRTDRTGSDEDEEARLQNIAAENCLLFSFLEIVSHVLFSITVFLVSDYHLYIGLQESMEKARGRSRRDLRRSTKP